jgi:hypothetical protein
MKVLQQFSLPGYFMSGKIIGFPSRGTNLASLYRTQAVPRPDEQAVLRLQIARISALLEELEGLIDSADGRSSPHLLQGRSIVERTRKILTSPMESTDNDGDPQPDVDRSLLERMYRDLNPIA